MKDFLLWEGPHAGVGNSVRSPSCDGEGAAGAI